MDGLTFTEPKRSRVEQ